MVCVCAIPACPPVCMSASMHRLSTTAGMIPGTYRYACTRCQRRGSATAVQRVPLPSGAQGALFGSSAYDISFEHIYESYDMYAKKCIPGAWYYWLCKPLELQVSTTAWCVVIFTAADRNSVGSLIVVVGHDGTLSHEQQYMLVATNRRVHSQLLLLCNCC